MHQKAKKQPKAPPIIAAPRAAIYLRVSTEEQASDGFGLDVQRERCRAQAVVKGWVVAGEYADEGLSGTKDERERPGLAALLAAVAEQQIDAVIILSLDRLGRKARITLDLVDRIVAAGVDLVSCKESLDTTTAAGRLVVGFFAIIAQWERDNIVERTTAGRNVRGRKDGEKGGRLPYGYKRTEQGIAIDRERAAVVRAIFRDRERRHHGSQQIAATLNSRGILGPRGGKWFASSVLEILSHAEAYRGGLRGDSPVPWPVILETQAALNRNDRS